MTSAGTVDVTAEGDGFLVSCNPPEPQHPPERFPTFRQAWGSAGGIRLVTGRSKRDLTGGANDPAARS